MSYPDWMSKLSDKLLETPLSEIAIPGSHDSASSEITKRSAVGPDLSPSLRRFNTVFCQIPKSYIVNWTVTQHLSLREQLYAGIRYFDFRLAFDSRSKDIYFTHGLLSSTLRLGMTDILNFIEAQPGEVLLLDFNHFYAMEMEQHESACKTIMHFISKYLYKQPSDKKIPSIKDCVDKKKRVILFYHACVGNKKYPFWDGSFIPSPWADTVNANELMDFLEKNYNQERSENSFYVTQGILTPDNSYIFKNLCKGVHTLSEQINPVFSSWLRKKCIGPKGINICIVDFCHEKDFIKSILGLNLLEYF